MDTPIFGDFHDFRNFSILCPGSSPLLPWRSQDVGRSLQLQNRGLRALEEAWTTFCWRHFSVKFGRFLRLWVAPGGVNLRSWNSQEVKGSPELQNGGLKALEEAWDDFLLEAFFPGHP